MKKSLALTLIVLALFIVLGAMRGARADEPVHLGPLRSAGAGESGQSIALSNARADEPGRTVLLSTSSESMASAPTTGLASPVRLFLDDGLVDDQVGLTDGGEFVWLNRFTPSPALFPFTLQQVQVAFFADSNCTIGNAIDIYVYSDADGNPANGATPVGSITGQTIQRFGWSTYSTNISLSGPGDVLIGVVNRGCSSPGQFPAAIDQSGSQGRSWVGFNAGPPGNPPTLPTTTFGTIDSFGFPGNWMIRGLGESNCTVGCPTPVPWPTPPPTATVAPFPAVSLVLDDGIDDVSLGLSHGGEFLWLNRFTPPAASFPFALREVHIFFALSTFCETGETIDIYIYQDADGNPANGATHVGSILGRTIQVIGGWSSYPTNIPLNGPGDVLIGVVSRECLYIGQSPATLDQSGSQGRSWIGSNLGPVGNPPVIPLFVFDTIDDTGFPGNWMIRGLGALCSGPCPTPPPSPTPTPTATPTPLPPNVYCAAPNGWIPDGDPTGTTSTLQVPQSGAITDVNVSVYAAHTLVGDLSFTVTHDAASATILDRPGFPLHPAGCRQGDIRALLDDAASLPVEDQCAGSVPAIEGAFSPNEPLAIFNGMDRAGTWTIKATDAVHYGVGRLRQWCVTFGAAGATYLPLVIR